MSIVWAILVAKYLAVAPCGAIFVNTPFQNKYGTATE
jgi:hypothetical protein